MRVRWLTEFLPSRAWLILVLLIGIGRACTWYAQPGHAKSAKVITPLWASSCGTAGVQVAGHNVKLCHSGCRSQLMVNWWVLGMVVWDPNHQGSETTKFRQILAEEGNGPPKFTQKLENERLFKHQNEGLEDGFPFPIGDFQVTCQFSFRGVWPVGIDLLEVVFSKGVFEQ